MQPDKLSSAFSRIKSQRELSGYLQEICTAIIEKILDRNVVEKILDSYGTNRSLAKIDLVHLTFEYIKIVLEDDVLTDDEKDDINYLKLLFGIHSRDFWVYNKSYVMQIIHYQLFRIYRYNLITDDEALFKADFQEMFDLSFDEMNEYYKSEAIDALQRGADIKDLDIFFTPTEYFKLKSNF